MKVCYLSAFLVFFALAGSAQEKSKIVEGERHQKTMSYSNDTNQTEAIAVFAKTYGLGSETTFKGKNTTKDKLGSSHQRHQQYYEGIEVVFGTLITHASNGKVTSVNGELYNPKGLSLQPTLSKEIGFSKAKDIVGAKTYLWEDSTQAKQMSYEKPKGELVIFPNVNNGTVHLAYRYDIYGTAPISRDEVYVDAKTGDILYRNPIIKHAYKLMSDNDIKKNAKRVETVISNMVPGTADTRYSGTRPIETTMDGSDFILLDTTRGNGVVTFNCEGMNAYQNLNFRDNDNTWSAAEFDNAAKDNGALDAHWGAEVTYDFWMENFNRNSFDDNGAAIISYVHYDDEDEAANDTGYDNAFWNGSVMTYGDGNTFDILTSLDVCGHEIGHAVCTFTADLAYQNQSGGMNEGYSDIWAAAVEHYGRTGSIEGAVDPNIWLIGEDINTPPLRSMSDPNSRNDPDTYLGRFWTSTGDEGTCVPAGGPTGNDFCGVHSNSGVLNHWFYLLTEGGSGTNNAPTPDTYDFPGIGLAKASEIAYITERDFLTPNATFADARNASIGVATTIYCANSPETIAVTNAWYAVNVGEAYVAYPKDAALVSITDKVEVGCAASGGDFVPELTVGNSGTEILNGVDVTYIINGGSPVTTTVSVNIAVCESAVVPVNIGNLTRGANTISFTVTTQDDGRTENNTQVINVVSNDAGTVNTINTFETMEEALVALNVNSTQSLWERGAASGFFLSAATTGNSTVYATNLDGNYTDNTIAYLVSQCYDLSTFENSVVSFDMGFDLEADWDYITFEYSTDSGISWTILGSALDPNWFNSSRVAGDGLAANCFNCPGAQWTGEGTSPRNGGGLNFQRTKYSHSLSDFDSAGSTERNIIFRFLFQSDAGVNEEGVFIDNFVVQGDDVTAGVGDFQEFEGLSVFPNPTAGNITVAGKDLANAKVSIIDISGRLISKNAAVYNGGLLQVTTSNLASGSYFLVIESDLNKSVRQIIKR